MITGVQFDPASTARFGSLIRELDGTVKRDSAEAARFAGATFIYSARAATPQSRKTRRLVDADPTTASMLATLGMGRVGIQVWRQDAPPMIAWFRDRSEARQSKLYTISRRGLAKLIWTFAAVKAGLTKGQSPAAGNGETTRAARNLSEGAKRKRDGLVEFEVANVAPYIATLDQGGPRNPAHRIMARAMENASKRLEWILTQNARRMARRWQ